MNIDNKEFKVIERVSFKQINVFTEGDLVCSTAYILKDIPNKLIIEVMPKITFDGNFYKYLYEVSIGYTILYNEEGKEIENVLKNKEFSKDFKKVLYKTFKDNANIDIDSKIK